jgi:hypothetical protein
VTLARSTDGGASFQNYAWTTEPFEAGEVFFGDYSGIAALGGRVYGVWTEKPPLESTDKDSAGKTADKSDAAQTKPHGTVIKVGTADFTGATAPSAAK